ncbi:MAG: ribosome silencing factor [Betaproteobacteria bacterium]|nr:ribosome silencing factor [Betaproteobacteria bacterium]
MNPKKMGALVIDALEDIKGKNIMLINVSKLTSLFDYIAIASGDSNRQTKALANNVREKAKEAGVSVYGSEGEESGEWVLVDLGDVVVHVMQPAVREYYRLEELWRDGKVEFPKPEKTEKAEKAAKPKAVAPKVAKKPAAKKPVTKRASGTAKSRSTQKRTTATAKAKPAAKPRAARKPKA